MTRAKKARARRRLEARPPVKRSIASGRVLVGIAVAAVILGVGLAWTIVGSDGGSGAADAGPVHVHGLGVNPADGALFIATHTGLFRAGEGESKAARVGDGYQDTMGFTVAGANRFLGSGHPDLTQDLPPLLGLIESTDAGESWDPVSLLGEADFHVLRFAGQRVYGYDASNDRLMVSGDTGRSWTEVQRPAPLVDLVVDPTDDRHVLAAAAGQLDSGLYESRDGGENWRRVGNAVGLLAWPASSRLYVVDGGGRVFSSRDGRDLRPRGEIGGEPAALLAQGAAELYAALHDGTIKQSTDGGATWTVRSTP